MIESGIDYDPWMEQLDAAHPNAEPHFHQRGRASSAQRRATIPHIWYRPDTMPALAHKLADVLSKRDPAHAAYFQSRLAAFLATLQPVHARIAALKARFGGTDVLATEPVFGYMATALGFKMHDMGFQNHVMNNVEPTARETEEFESLLRGHKVKVLFYNGQASDPVASRMQDIAKAVRRAGGRRDRDRAGGDDLCLVDAVAARRGGEGTARNDSKRPPSPSTSLAFAMAITPSSPIFPARSTRGEFVAVLGPNGAGKSTLLRGAAGPDAGRTPAASRFSATARIAAARRSATCRSGAANNAASSLSGRAYLHAVLDGHQWGFAGRNPAKNETIHEALRAVDAEAFADRPFNVLSGGERQRISLAQALLGRPRILLLDEPLLNLDPRRQGELIDIVHGICEREKVTVLFVGHDINPADQGGGPRALRGGRPRRAGVGR